VRACARAREREREREFTKSQCEDFSRVET